jgi:hypothetical protein
MTRDESARKYPKPVDILDRVQPSADRDEGFSGRLDKGRKEPS